MIQVLKQKEGLFKLFFQGVESAIASHLLRVGIFFPLREMLLSYIGKSFKNIEYLQNEMIRSIISSFIARTVTTIIAFPFEVKKIDSQLNLKFQKQNNWIKDLSWMKRLLPTFLQFYQKEMFNTMFFWIVYEIRKKYLKENYDYLTEVQLNIKCAVFAGTISAFFSHPFDYSQTITNTFRRDVKPLTTSELLRNLKKRNGYLSILSGITYRTLRGGTINFIFFSLFENIKHKDNGLNK